MLPAGCVQSSCAARLMFKFVWDCNFMSACSLFLLFHRFEELTIQAHRWSPASTAPGHLSHFCFRVLFFKCYTHTHTSRKNKLYQELYIQYIFFSSHKAVCINNILGWICCVNRIHMQIFLTLNKNLIPNLNKHIPKVPLYARHLYKMRHIVKMQLCI